MRSGIGRGFLLLLALALQPNEWLLADGGLEDPSPRKTSVDANDLRLPLHFEPNRGQVDREVKFFTRGSGYVLFLTANESVVVLDHTILRQRLEGASAGATAEGLDPLRGRSHYFMGNDPAKWNRDVPHYARVRFTEIYPGIDLIYYANRQDRLEFDFVVMPGADPARIRMRFEGAERIRIDEQGDLVLSMPGRELRMQEPVLYQEVNGGRLGVRGGYRLEGEASRTPMSARVESSSTSTTVTVETAPYDTKRPLVIDPVLVYSTFLGGSLGDGGSSIALDSEGNAYVSGATASLDFPRVDALQPTYGGGSLDGFVARIEADGSGLVYATYLGGSGSDSADGIALDGNGDVYVTGYTDSTNFPTVNPLQAAKKGGIDAFVAKLGASGSALVYSTYLGGSNTDAGLAIAMDPARNAHVTGNTGSTDFPTAHAIQTSFGGGPLDGFVAKLDPAGAALVYSTYLGGSEPDFARGIAVDAAGSAYVAGFTYSHEFPTVNPLQSTLAGVADAFVTKITADGSALTYSTYLGGSGSEFGPGLKLIAVDAAGSAYVTGSTLSTDFPLVSPVQAASAGSLDAFVAKIAADGSALVYSTYLGGTSGDDGNAIAVDDRGNTYVTGTTSSADFPTVDPFQGSYRGTSGDAFVAMIRADGTEIVYSSFLGGTGPGPFERANAIAVDPASNAYVTGQTNATDFPTVDPLQPSFGGVHDAFVTKIGGVLAPAEVSGVSWNSTATLSWTVVPGAVTYHVYRGVPPDLPKLLDARPDSCLRLSTTEPTSGPVLEEVPALGTFYWYLVRAENTAGLGPAGDATAGPRIHDPAGSCP